MTKDAFSQSAEAEQQAMVKISPWTLADYQSQSRLLIFFSNISKFYLICRFILLNYLTDLIIFLTIDHVNMDFNLFFKKRLTS